jgi:hypothetical protein
VWKGRAAFLPTRSVPQASPLSPLYPAIPGPFPMYFRASALCRCVFPFARVSVCTTATTWVLFNFV